MRDVLGWAGLMLPLFVRSVGEPPAASTRLRMRLVRWTLAGLVFVVVTALGSIIDFPDVGSDHAPPTGCINITAIASAGTIPIANMITGEEHSATPVFGCNTRDSVVP